MQRKLRTMLRAMTQTVLIKYRIEQRKRMEDLHVKQFEDAENEIADVLEPYFSAQIESIASRLSSGSSPEAIIDAAYNIDKATEELIDIIFPILAHAMEESLLESNELLNSPPDRMESEIEQSERRVIAITKSTASEWLAANGIDLPPGISADLPQWMIDAMEATLMDTFSQDYWERIAGTTRDDVLQIIANGLEEGESIANIARALTQSFSGTYSRSRAVRVARTETGGALNSSRRAAIDRLAEEIPGIRSEWFSVKKFNSREEHVGLDGVVADDDGFFNLNGVLVPYPGHHSLPAGDRVQCLCTLLTSFSVS